MKTSSQVHRTAQAQQGLSVLENVYNDSILEMYTTLEYNKDARIKALITYRDSTTYPLACDKWATIYFFNAEGKCYNTIRGYLGYIDR